MQVFAPTFSSNVMCVRVLNRCKPILLQEFRGDRVIYYFCSTFCTFCGNIIILTCSFNIFLRTGYVVLYSKQEIKIGSRFQLMQMCIAP